jgi:hypothetical protein
MFLRLFMHLLPRARAWSITIDGKLRQFFEGLAASIGAPVRLYLDMILLDLFPDTTRELEEWERQFDIRYTSGLTEAARRERLAGAWRALGGQDPQYIQDTLQGAGFDVYVHEWWVPGTEAPPGVHAAPVVRNPFSYLYPTSSGGPGGMQAGEPLALAGEAFAQAGNVAGVLGYPLVNKLLYSTFDYLTCAGEALAQAGEPGMLAGERTAFYDLQVVYQIPSDPATWPYFLYIGAPAFGTLAQVPASRRDEFEELLLKIAPAHVWLGVMVVYT